jgi:DNA (cytosine-5)-methyltransferase 1
MAEPQEVRPLKILDLFSGIGAFSLGLERAGMQVVAFCEIDQFCRRVLAKHWPEVPCYDDVRTLTANRLRADGIGVNVICGGFPCQDISVAGRGAGLAGERSGLWSEFARLIGEIRPRYAIVENVAALLGRGLGDVLGDLAALGYDAEWHCIPAAAVGAPHRRDRVWIVAYAPVMFSDGRDHYTRSSSRGTQQVPQPGNCSGYADMANAGIKGLSPPEHAFLSGAWWREERRAVAERGWWRAEPDVGRVAHGVASRVDRLRGLGNSLVPQIPELIGRAIMGITQHEVGYDG